MLCVGKDLESYLASTKAHCHQPEFALLGEELILDCRSVHLDNADDAAAVPRVRRQCGGPLLFLSRKKQKLRVSLTTYYQVCMNVLRL